MTSEPSDSGPDLVVGQEGAAGGQGPWDVTFRVGNRGTQPVELVQAWVPHPRFRAGLLELADAGLLAAGASTRLRFSVAFDEPPGTDVENTFIILQTRWRGERWRVLTRMTATSGPAGAPTTRVETVTSHRVGFSA